MEVSMHGEGDLIKIISDADFVANNSFNCFKDNTKLYSLKLLKVNSLCKHCPLEGTTGV